MLTTDSDPELAEIASIPISNFGKVTGGSAVRTGVRIPIVFDRTIRRSAATSLRYCSISQLFFYGDPKNEHLWSIVTRISLVLYAHGECAPKEQQILSIRLRCNRPPIASAFSKGLIGLTQLGLRQSM
jgi:hypothetical protein